MCKPKPSKDGTYMLKCDPLYKPSHNISKEIKLYQLISTKRKVSCTYCLFLATFN